MAWKPVSNTVPQYHVSGSPASGYYLKFYKSGTTTAISMATDSTGGTTLAKCAINSEGYPINGSSAVFIPHINQPYKVVLYTNSTDADADTTGNAAWIVDALSHETPNTSVYELGSTAAATSHPAVTGYTITTNYHDSDRVAGSGGTFRFTGTTTAGKAGDWPNADGSFYDADGKQFAALNPHILMFGAVPDGLTTNDTTAFTAAFASLSANVTLTIGGGPFYTNGVISTTQDNAHIHFDGATIYVGDTGTAGTLNNTASGKIGFLFQNCDQLKITGAVRLEGQGTIGTTSLCGVAFDTCTNMLIPCDFDLDTMSLGVQYISCTRGAVGNITARYMDGLQTFESPPSSTAGSALVCAGVSHVVFGDIRSFDMHKPGVYLSVGTGTSDNSYLTFGNVIGEHDGASEEAIAFAVRSGVDIHIASVIGSGGISGLYVDQVSGDIANGYNLDRISVGSVLGSYSSTGASVDSPVIVQSSETTPDIGVVSIGTVDVVAAGEFGIFVNAGTLKVNSANVVGGVRGIVLSGAQGGCTGEFGQISVSGQTNQAVLFGHGCNLRIGYADISGPVSAATGAITFDNTSGSGGIGKVDIGTVRYAQNGAANNYLDVYTDATNGLESANIHHVEGVGSRAAATFGASTYQVERIVRGKYYVAAAPTGNAHTVGTILYNNAPTAGTATNLGFVCTTAGTPGTWKGFGDIAS